MCVLMLCLDDTRVYFSLQDATPGAAQRMKKAPEGPVWSWLPAAGHPLPHQACVPVASQPFHASKMLPAHIGSVSKNGVSKNGDRALAFTW